ncbi:hypothetical protein N658DRAFT_514801 [Parathielavia hyrcaniae]|uniref:Uncharacterized protein n=1 Tax=Parathielavia hyrcaniae TaxID=113614 RepID=A0AAN6T332_9PEZI|nr:hypothetical protein N658DRAFT_514801 [Parathielavia hyrcaniae]
MPTLVFSPNSTRHTTTFRRRHQKSINVTEYARKVTQSHVDNDDASGIEYRLQIGSRIRYLVTQPRTLSRDALSFPLKRLFSNRAFAVVNCRWHDTAVDFLDVEKTKQLTATAFEATVLSDVLPLGQRTRTAQVTKVYQLLEGSGLASRFLAHVHKNWRLIGFLLEKLDGRRASTQDLGACQASLEKLYGLRLLYGDVNRYNFLVMENDAKLIDFEGSSTLQHLRLELADESGRGGGLMFRDSCD